MFGLMHGNVTQFLYAAVIGVVLGYVAVKTGRMRYNRLLHILINSWSLVIAMLGTQDTLLPLFITFLMTGFMGCTIIGSFVLLIFNFRKIRLSDGGNPRGCEIPQYMWGKCMGISDSGIYSGKFDYDGVFLCRDDVVVSCCSQVGTFGSESAVR